MTVYNTTRFAFQDTPLSKWKAVNLAYECALAAREAFRRDELTPALDAFMAVRSQWPEDSQLKQGSIAQLQIEKARALLDPIQAEFDALDREVNDAVDEMITTPAPSVAAMATKLHIRVESDCRGSCSNDDVLAALLTDARRLSGEPV